MRAKHSTLRIRTLRRRRLALALVAAMAVPVAMAQTIPQGGNVTSGDATIGLSGNTVVINQTTRGAIIDWGSFSIGSGYGVDFQNGSGVTLNRVIGFGYGPSASVIDGSLTSTGTVFLVNRAGVAFGGGATINVGGLIASTIDISNADFNAGLTSNNYVFRAGAGAGDITNNADIVAASGGTIGFLGQNVTNFGSIEATGGSVVFGAASAATITLDPFGDGLTQLVVQQAAASGEGLIRNYYGSVNADGGQIIMRTTNAAGGTAANIINAGTLRARSLASRAGRIELTAGTGSVSVGGFPDGFQPGLIDVSGGSHAAGSVLLSGNSVAIFSDFSDPTDASRIDASGAAGGGTVDLQATDIAYLYPGTSINAEATDAGNGGRVRIIAGNDVTMLGDIRANAGKAGGDGGVIGLQSIAGNVLAVGTLDANGSSSGNGGDVALAATAGIAGLNGEIRANGGVNGGRVQILGTGTLVSAASIIGANGGSGSGGSIALAASDALAAYGSLSARGNSAGGGIYTATGGAFDIQGLRVDAGSAGTAGTWVMQAPNITVVSGNDSGPVDGVVQLGEDLQDGEINNALTNGTNVTLYAGTGPDDGGNIHFSEGVDIFYDDGSVPLQFRADANGSITGNNFSIGTNDASLSMAFNADASNLNSGFAGISFDGAYLDSNGGDILMYGQSDPLAGVASSYDRGVSLTDSTITTGGGNLVVRGASTGDDAGPDDAGVVFDGTNVYTAGGNASINGSGAGITGGVYLHAGLLTIDAPPVVTLLALPPLASADGYIDIVGTAAGSGDGVRVWGNDLLTQAGYIGVNGSAAGAGRGTSVISSKLATQGGDIGMLGQSSTGVGLVMSGDADLGDIIDAAPIGGNAPFVIDSQGGRIYLEGSGGLAGVAMLDGNPDTAGDNTVDSGGGAIDIIGAATAANGYGVYLGGVPIAAGSGNVTVDGTAPLGIGVLFANGASVSTTTGAISVIGTGADFGLDIADGAIDTDSGDILLDGTATSMTATAGVRVTGGGLSTSGGSITVTGASAGGAGVQLGDGGAFAIGSGGGAISITGIGATAGVLMQGNQVDSGGGNIDVDGEASGIGAVGVDLTDAQLTAGAGDVGVTGIAANGTGVRFAGKSGIATTTGDIGVTGIGAQVGLALSGGALRTDSGHFDLRGRGTGASSDGLVIGSGISIATNGGGVELSGEGGSGAGILMQAGSSVEAGNSLVVVRAGNDGSSDALRIGGTIGSSTGVNLRPGGVDANGGLTERTGDQILVGGGTAGFALSGAELAMISAPELVIGSNLHAGAIRVLGATTRNGNLTLQNDGGSGGIDLQAAVNIGSNTLALSSGGSITQTSAGAITAQSLLARAGGNVLLAVAANDVSANTLAGSAGGDFRFQDVDNLSIGNVSARGFDASAGQLSSVGANGISAGGDVFVRNLAGDLTLNAGVRGADIDLVTAGRLQNVANASLVASGEWRVWANTWIGETRGGLAGSGNLPNLYGCAYLGACGVTVPGVDNHFIYVQQPTALVTFNNFSREYGLPNPLLTFSVTGAILGDTSANVASGSATTSATVLSDVGNYAIGGNFLSAAGYRIQFVPGNLAITPATLFFTSNGAVRYLGTANPPLSGTVTGFRNADTIQSVFGNGVIWSTPAGLLTPIGFYPINGGTTARNYVFSQAPGNATALQIIPLPQLPSTPIDLIRETVNTYLYDRNIGGAPVCAINASLDDQQLASSGDELSNEWSKVRSRPNLTNCFESERKNSCGDF